MKKVLSIFLVAAAAFCGFNASAVDSLRVEYLGSNHTMLRIPTDQSKCVLLPVQEANEDANVNVIVDGKFDRNFAVRLSRTKVDYMVPFDLTPYAGKELIFDIFTHQGRQGVRDASDDSVWRRIALVDTFDVANTEKYRPAFHHTPLYGWMNDPNGMFYKDGVWHLYYQWNPYGSKWQNMTWGHSTSTDLINWEHQPTAIEPNGLGAVFSGSSVLDPNNTVGFGPDAVIAMYTSADKAQTQSLAWSEDNGQSFNIYPGNPVLTLPSEARDPNMFWDERSGKWVLVLAHALEREMLFFTSPDMKTWTLTGSFGKGVAAQGGVWECPDLFPLTVPGTNRTKWVLLCNLNPGGPFGGSATQYFIGDFDGETFTADRSGYRRINTRWMDYGKDHYATVTFSDTPGRRTALGWMSNWQYAAEVPTMQFRSANTLPRELSLFKGPDNEFYLASNPSPELETLRDTLHNESASFTISARATSFELPSANDGICEILVEIDPAGANVVDITLSNSEGEKVAMSYDVADNSFAFDRRESGVTDFSMDFPAVTYAPTFSTGKKLTLRIYVDRSSIEVFGNDGRFVMTNLVFPTAPYSTLSFSCEGGNARAKNLKVYSLSITSEN